MINPKKRDFDLEQFAASLSEAQQVRGISLSRDAWRRLRKNYVAFGSLIFLIFLTMLAVLTPLLPLQPPRHVDLPRQFQSPTFEMSGNQGIVFENGKPTKESLEAGFGKLDRFSGWLLDLRFSIFHDRTIPSICGTDLLGRDVLSRLFWGARISLAVGLVATLVSLIIGVTYGAISGYAGGRVDNLMMRLVDVMYSIPFIFVVIFLISVLNAAGLKGLLMSVGIGQETVTHGWLSGVVSWFDSSRIFIFFFVVGAIYWLTMARVVRGQVLSLKNEPFIEAARAIGASRRRIVFIHLIPNLLSVVIVYLTLTIPRVMLFEAFLSFLGLGVEPPDVSWGLLANEGLNSITRVRTFYWLIVFPSIALGVTLWALNFLGDGLRDALDPRLKNK